MGVQVEREVYEVDVSTIDLGRKQLEMKKKEKALRLFHGLGGYQVEAT